MKHLRFPALLLCVFCLLLMVSCNSVSPKAVLREISEKTETDLSAATVSIFNDSHGGFLGDGSTFAVLACKDTDIAENIGANGSWKPLPLSENCEKVVYGKGDEGPLLAQFPGAPALPPIEKGAYCFLDRHSEAADPHDDSDLFVRASFNFSLALFDAATETVYFIEFDT